MSWKPNPNLPGGQLLDLGPLGDLSVYESEWDPSRWRAVWGNWNGDAGWDQDGYVTAEEAQRAAETWMRGALAQAWAALGGPGE